MLNIDIQLSIYCFSHFHSRFCGNILVVILLISPKLHSQNRANATKVIYKKRYPIYYSLIFADIYIKNWAFSFHLHHFRNTDT